MIPPPYRDRLEEVAGRQSSPSTGKLSAPPAGKPGYFLALENLRRSLLRHFVPSVFKESYWAPSVAFLKAWRNLSGPMWSQNQNQNQNQTKPWGEADTASRRSAPSPGRRTRREDHVLAHRPQMSSGRLFLDRVARHHCPSPLHRHTQNNTHSAQPQAKGDVSTLPGRGHFYFALTGCQSGSTSCFPYARVVRK